MVLGSSSYRLARTSASSWLSQHQDRPAEHAERNQIWLQPPPTTYHGLRLLWITPVSVHSIISNFVVFNWIFMGLHLISYMHVESPRVSSFFRHSLWLIKNIKYKLHETYIKMFMNMDTSSVSPIEQTSSQK